MTAKSPRAFALLVLLNMVLLASVAFLLADRTRETERPPLSAISTAQAQNRTTASRTRTPAQPLERVNLVEAARIASPSIVSIGASRTTLIVSPFAGFFSDYVVYPYAERIPYLGSGVIISGNGLVVTNFHVVENTQDVFVTLPDGRELPGKVLDADTLLDIALIQVEGENLPAARLGDAERLEVGEPVLAMGNPFGNLIGDPTPTVTAGVVSALRRTFRPAGQVQKAFYDMIQTDAAINPGNSGGALVNSRGEVIGLNTFIVSRSGSAAGIGFAIPIHRVRAIVEEILQHGRIRSRIMDFQVQNLTPSVARFVRTSATQGAVVVELARNGPAFRAGLRVNDVITAIDGRPVKDAAEFNLILWTQPVGTTFRLTIDRGGESKVITYTLVEAP
jgi:S1-C subfamily serine protease